MMKVGMTLLMGGGFIFTVMPYLDYKLGSVVCMTSGYFMVKYS